jgi:hypothetical protein
MDSVSRSCVDMSTASWTTNGSQAASNPTGGRRQSRYTSRLTSRPFAHKKKVLKRLTFGDMPIGHTPPENPHLGTRARLHAEDYRAERASLETKARGWAPESGAYRCRINRRRIPENWLSLTSRKGSPLEPIIGRRSSNIGMGACNGVHPSINGYPAHLASSVQFDRFDVLGPGS